MLTKEKTCMDGARLKRLRKERKLTQSELGKIINVSKVSISGYESGDRSPDTDNLRRLADFFNVSTDYLMGRTDNKENPEEEEFQEFISDPELERWYRDLSKSKEEDLRRLRRIWEAFKEEDNK